MIVKEEENANLTDVSVMKGLPISIAVKVNNQFKQVYFVLGNQTIEVSFLQQSWLFLASKNPDSISFKEYQHKISNLKLLTKMNFPKP